MFPFHRFASSDAETDTAQAVTPPHPAKEGHPLDELTHGAFSAATSAERLARIGAWLATDPGAEQMQQVFRELSAKDKGAAKLIRERLDDIRRDKAQGTLAKEWAEKAEALLAIPRLNLADAMAWQRDAARASAPLGREPLSGLRARLQQRVQVIEDLHHRVQVQREAAALLAQRIESLSTRSWKDAEAAQAGLDVDIARWDQEASTLVAEPDWASIDPRFPPMLAASQEQLRVVWTAFREALAMATAASADVDAPVPYVPLWAEELRQVRGAAAEPGPAVDPAVQARAVAATTDALNILEEEIAQGHGKASAGAANALRAALKEHGRWLDEVLAGRVHAALGAASELEGWQRWRADQLRTELVTKAQRLLHPPQGEAPLQGKKLMETLRQLREQWKVVDQGGVPNHALWRRFDEACNEAHRLVEAWQEKLRAENAEHRARRLTLIEEVQAWARSRTAEAEEDWKGVSRTLQQFALRWQQSGHVSEKTFAELQPLWKAAMDEVGASLRARQHDSLAARNAMVVEAQALADEADLRIDAIRALQQRWQAEAAQVPLDRRLEQKLWEAFRAPIDAAFARKSAQRQRTQEAMGERDRQVCDAAQAVQDAIAKADVQAIRAALAMLEECVQGAAGAAASDAPPIGQSAASQSPAEEGQSGAAAIPARKPVVAVRGDDRPGAKLGGAPAPVPRRGAGGDAPHASRRGAPPVRGKEEYPARTRSPEQRPPRLGDTAFRAQRDAGEQAQIALRKLAAQAHGEALMQLLGAWEQRDAAKVPTVQEIGSRVHAAARSAWAQAIASAPAGEADTALLRIELAAQVPTPAAHLPALRALQLQMLTRRNDPPPALTWAQDVSVVLASAYDAAAAQRLQGALKVLLRR